MRIQHNIMAMSAYRNYTNNVSAMKKNLEKLSSGYKINRAGDDAAGLAISEKMRAQITGLETAQKNAKDGISLVQTAEGALTEVHDMLNRMVELATQSANGTYDNTTDRKQMQKEIDQLLEEIDRIADSSNFNGIKLLDGTLGMNTDAFEVEYTAASADKAIDISKCFTTATTSPDFHLSGPSLKQKSPTFTVDFNALAMKNVGTATKASFTVNIAGASFSASSVAVGASAIGSIGVAIATRVFAALSSASGCISIGSGANAAWFKASVSGAKITFTFIGVGSTASKASAAGTSSLTADAAAAINAVIGNAVTVEVASGSGISIDTEAFHNAINVTLAQAETPKQPAGITFTLNSDIVKDGNVLTIDGKEFIFKTDKDSTVTAGNDQTLIDVSEYADNMKINAAAAGLSHYTTDNFQIEHKLDGTIHIDQLESSDKNYTSAAMLKSVFSATTPAANASVKITVTDSSLQEGNTLTIDGKKFVFGEGENTDDVTYISVKNGAANLAAELTKIYGTTAVNNVDGVITITAGSAAAAAPVILGKGLTLQIGDTSDDFNQLNVAVNDMHASSLGIAGLDISNQESAQAAIDKIKAAINQVSDVRGTLGATQNRLDHTINNLAVMTENIQDAESSIRDVDIAEEMMAYTKNNILIQSAQAMLAQANQVPQGVLQLLQ